MKRLKQTSRHRGSTLLMNPLDGGRQREQQLVMCCHCGKHMLLGAAIAKQLRGDVDIADKLGYCAQCDGVHCPGERCAVCVPRERQLDNLEKGLPILTPGPAMISTSGLLLDFPASAE